MLSMVDAPDGQSYGAVVMVQNHYMGKGGRRKLARLEKAQIRVSMVDENLNRIPHQQG
jgi:hypothetical protein